MTPFFFVVSSLTYSGIPELICFILFKIHPPGIPEFLRFVLSEIYSPDSLFLSRTLLPPNHDINNDRCTKHCRHRTDTQFNRSKHGPRNQIAEQAE